MNEQEHDHMHGDCTELLANLSGYIDGELDEQLCSQIKDHLAGCQNCRVVYDTTTRTIYMYQHNPAEPEMPNGVRERLFSKLNLDDLLQRSEK